MPSGINFPMHVKLIIHLSNVYVQRQSLYGYGTRLLMDIDNALCNDGMW